MAHLNIKGNIWKIFMYFIESWERWNTQALERERMWAARVQMFLNFSILMRFPVALSKLRASDFWEKELDFGEKDRALWGQPSLGHGCLSSPLRTHRFRRKVNMLRKGSVFTISICRTFINGHNFIEEMVDIMWKFNGWKITS